MASDQATESFSNSRRNFIKMAAAGSAVASALSAASATIAQEAAVSRLALESRTMPSSMQTLNSDYIGLKRRMPQGFLYCVKSPIFSIILQATSGRAAITVGQLWEELTPEVPDCVHWKSRRSEQQRHFRTV